MFDSIIYKNTIGPGPLIDIGALAEGLLFYGRVAVIGNSATVKYLLNYIPPFILLSLMRDGRFEFYYLGDQVGVSTTTQRSNGRSHYDLVRFSSPQHTIETIGPKAFIDAAGSSGQAMVGARQFTKLLRPLDHSAFNQASILHALSDTAAIETTIASLIREAVPKFVVPNEMQFKIESEKEGLYVNTNIDFVGLNKLYHEVVPPKHSSLTEAYLLSLIQGAYEAAFFSASLNSEIAVHPIEKAIQARTLEAVVHRYTHSRSEIESFSDLTLTNTHAIREAVNSGAVPFTSVVKLLDSADKFRNWLHKQPADANLVRAYYQETIKDSWAEKLPAKTTRWSIFTGIGLGLDALGAAGLGTAAGVAISAVDAFLVDKLIKGWKPHQFVEKELKPLVDNGRKGRP